MKPKPAHLRILSLLLCLSLIIGMAPMIQLFTPAAATTATEVHDCGHDSAHTDWTVLGVAGSTTTLTADQVTDMSDGGNFVLAGDVVLPSTVTMRNTTTAQTLHICLNGHDITTDGYMRAFLVGGKLNSTASKNQTLNLCDCSADHSGSISAYESDTTTATNGLIAVDEYGYFNMYGGTVNGLNTTGNGGAFYVCSWKAYLNVYGGTITGGTAAKGGAIYATNGTTTIEGGTITGNTATGDGGAVYISNTGNCNYTKLFLKGGTISNNKAANGGAVWMHTYNLDGTTVRNGKVELSGTTISGNEATSKGGAFYVDAGTLELKSGNITGNTGIHGGTIGVGATGEVKMSGGKISGNTGTTTGSVFFSNSCRGIEITGGEITGNYGKQTAVVSGTTLTMTGGTIDGNKVSADEGAAAAALKLNNYLAASTGVFSGTAVVGDAGVEVALIQEGKANYATDSTASIGNLAKGASVLAQAKLTVTEGDTTVKETAVDGGYLYTIPGEKISGRIDSLDPGTYILEDNLTLSGALTLAEGEYTIDLAGKNITGEAAPYFSVPAGVTLTIADSVGTGKIDGSALQNSTATGLIYVSGGGIFNLKGGVITGHTTTGNGGGIYTTGGASRVNILGGEISNNVAAQAGGIWANGGIVTISGGKITNNEGRNNYGGVYAAGLATINMTGGEISNNTTAGNGGGIGAGGNKAVLTFSGGKISGNSALNGGAFYLASPSANYVNTPTSLTISGGEITGNIADDKNASQAKGNGSVLLSNKCVLNITGGVISNNKSEGDTITVSASTIVVTGGKISGNTKLDGTTVANFNVNNSGNPSNITISGNPIIEDPLYLSPARTNPVVAASTGSIGTLTEGASILSKHELTVDSSDETVTKATVSGGYLYTYGTGTGTTPTPPPSTETLEISGEIESLAPGSYILKGNVTLKKALSLTAGEYTIDLNGYNITGEALPYFTVPTGVTLNLKDTKDGTKGKIQGLATADNTMILVTGGVLNIADIALTGQTIETANSNGETTRGSVIRADEGGKITMASGSIYGNTSADWATIYLLDSNTTFTMTGGEIYANTSARGSAVAGRSGTVINIEGGKIGKAGDGNGNTAQYGGAIYADQNKLNISGGEIAYSNGTTNGGAIYGNKCTIKITGGVISNNTSAGKGPAIDARGSTLEMSGGEIKNNGTDKTAVDLGTTGGVTSSAMISGNAVIDQGAIEATGSISFYEVTEGASVYTKLKGTRLDTSAKEASEGNLYLYTYDPDGGNSGSQNVPSVDWTLFTDDFSDYTVGDDTLYESINTANGAAKPWWTTNGGAHGAVTDASYAQYGIVDQNGNKVLRLHSVSTNASSKSNAWAVTKNAISGPYTLKLDFLLTDNNPQFIVNLFQGSTLGGTIMAYIDASNGPRILHTNNKTDKAYKADGSEMNSLSLNTWYSMEFTCEEGKVTLTVWERDNESVKGTAVKTTNEISKAVLLNANTVRLQNRGYENRTTTTLVDNLSITKPVALSMQEFVAAAPGKVMDTLPIGTAANQQPNLKYQYVLGDASFGTTNAKGQLVAGNAEGETSLKLVLLDIRGNATDISYETIFVVGNNNGVSIGDDIKVPETDINKTQQLTATVDPDVAAAYPNYKISWISSNEAVATVDQNGLLTYKGYGSAKITAMLIDAEGNQTRYFASINTQIGEKALKILSIGNSFSRDSLYYISKLAFAAGKRVEAAYLMRSSADLQDHAYNLAHNVADYSWYVSNAYNGDMLYVSGGATIQEKVESQDWDIIILHQGVNSAGNRSTFNADLEYLVDYLEDVQPNAKLYWNMTWALEDGFTAGTHGKDFNTYYGADQKVMYNAIVSVIDEFFVGNDALFNSANANNLGGKLGWGFDGYFANGAALQSLRETIDHDKDLTRDGFHLSIDIGRMTTSLTILKTLYPDLDLSVFTESVIGDIIITDKNDYNGTGGTVMDTDESTYTYTAADLPKIIQAVTNAVAISKSGVPAKVAAKSPVDPGKTNSQIDNIIQVEAPMKVHFPDVKVLSDGTLIAGYYENLDHVPQRASDVDNPYAAMIEGVGRLVVFESKDGGKTWNNANPILVADEFQMEKWGMCEVYGRYDRIGAGTGKAYTSFADPRDPNFGTAFVDFDNDGDKEEVILFTLWIRYYDAKGGQSISNTLWMLTGVKNADGTYTWVETPTQITSAGVKRGDITAYADGEILVPTYSGNTGYAVSMTWDPATQTWKQNENRQIPNLATEEDTTFNEISLVVPDPEGDTVFAFCRQNGTVLKSADRGKTWELIGNEPGKIHQPGFALLDENSAFVTWAETSQPRDIYGKVFYFDADWSDTQTHLIYASKNTANHDTGDPSCAVNADGKVVVLSYDTEYRSIIVNIIDPMEAKWQPIEMTDDIDDVVIYENETDVTLGTTNVIPETVKPNGAYTVSATVKFATKNDSVTIATASGSITISAGDLALNTPTNIIVKSVGSQNYIKVWQGATEPAGFTVYTGKGTAAEQPTVSGSGATLTDVKVTVKFKVELQESLEATKGQPAIQLEYLVQPESAGYVFTSSDERVVKVNETGLVTFVDEGTAIITLTVGNAVTMECEVRVKSQPAELTGRGETSNIVVDDFEEDKYTAGENALWNDYWADKANSFYNFENAAGMTKDSYGNTRYNIVQEADGNQYLELKGATTWMMNKQAITGNYTTQFDIMFTGTGRSLNLTPWQNDLLVETNQIHGFINLQANQYRFQFRPYDLWEYPSTSANDDQPVANPNMYCTGNNNLSTDATWDSYDGGTGFWQTVKVTRVDGGLYLKIWKTGTQEPEEWTCALSHDVLDTDMDSHFRFQFDCGSTGQSVYIDNLSITQQVVDSYTVNFVNGETTTPQKVEEGTKVFAPRTPVKAGHTFVGWYNGETAYDFNAPVTGNLTLTAKWAVNKYTVSFDSGVAAQTVEYGAKATKPADPTKEGFVFAGWYLGTELYDFNAAVTGSISLIAKWTEKVTIPVSGKENTIDVDVTVEEGIVVVQSIDPEELDKIIGSDVETGDVVIDLSELDEEVVAVVLPKDTFEKILEAAQHAQNDTEQLVIVLPEATVELDDKTMHAIVETIDVADGDVGLIVVTTEAEDLNDKQQDALKDKEVYSGISVVLVCTESGDLISDFKGGKATLKVPFEIPANHKAEGFAAWYVAEDGTMTKMETKYEDGHLVWSTGHFSDYVILYEEPAPEGEQPGGNQPGGNQPGGNQPGGEQPGGNQPGGNQPGGNGGQTGNDDPSKTGDNAMPAVFLALVLLSMTALVVVITGKKKLF